MANVLNIENLTKSYGDRLLFGDVTFGVDEGDKIGVVARNGTGKSTMLRIIAGEEEPDSGNIVFRNGIRVGYLAQEPVFPQGLTPMQIASEAVPVSDHTAEWERDVRISQVLSQLGLHSADTPVEKLSGGQRKRLAIALTVLAEPDFLILDEPTNHLDISTIEWLEGYLRRSRATLLMVTHDRYFLDRVCSKIIELDDRSVFEVEGNYDMYLDRKSVV